MTRFFTHFVSSRTAFLLGLDLLILMVAAYAGIAFQLSLGQQSVSAAFVVPQVAGFAFAMLFVMSGVGVYQLDLSANPKALAVRMAAAFSLGCILAVMGPALIAEAHDLEHWNLGVTALVGSLGCGLVRFGFQRLARLSRFKRRVLVLGSGSRLARFAEVSRRNQSIEVVGCIGPQTAESNLAELRILSVAPGERLCAIAAKHRIDEIVVGVRDRRNGGLPVQELLECRLKGVKVTDLPIFFEREYRQIALDSINPSWMIFGEGFNQGRARSCVKRAFDIIASLFLLLPSLPVMLITAICIIIEDGMPVFYRQERVGQHGRVFTILKFRSMRNDAERDGVPRWAATNDDRITRVGRIIRMLRIDELPQILNVLRGEMSFVGPRPERPFFVEKLASQIPYYSARHSVKPGITGWAQVRYAYGASIEDTVEKLQYDLYYVKNHGLFLDLMTLIATIEVVLWGKGAR